MKSKAVVFLLAAGLLLGRSAFGFQDLIQNNNFSGPSSWAFSGFATTQTGVTFANFLSMGNVNGPNTQIIFQQVTIPTNTIFAQFSYDWDATSTSTEPANSVEFFSYVADGLNDDLETLDEEFNGNIGVTQNTRTNLAAFAGQTINMSFEVDAQDAGSGLGSSFGVVQVHLLAFTTNDIPPNDFFTNSTVLNTTTNISVLGTNFLATKESGEPPKIAGNTGGHSLWWNWTAPSNGTVVVSSTGVMPDSSTLITLLGVFTGNFVTNLAPVASSSGSTSQVKFTVSTGTTYHIAVDGKNGATGIVELNLSFSLDTKNPTVAISSPASNAKLTNSTVVVKGTATDNVAVGSVQYRLVNAQATNADFQAAVGTNTWTATIPNLIPGPNTIQVFSVDTSGNQSPVMSRAVTFIVVSPLTVTVNGTGTISPNATNQLEDVGATITLTAKPGPGEVFSNWVGPDGVLATTTALTFTMQSNLVLQANFVPNPFTPIVGDYQGLFYNTDTPEHASSGFFNVTLSSSGSYSAKVIVAGANYSLSGQFSAGGVASNNIVRKGLTTVSVQMQLDLSGGGISGQLSDGTWVANLTADPVVTSAAAAKYTVIIPGADDPATQPGGNGYATVAVSTKGDITLGGALTDGTKITQKANLLSTGHWAFYVPLYSGKGSIFGWFTFSNAPDSDLEGEVDWFKLSGASGKLYPAGFTNITDVTGSLYQFTNNVPVLNFTNNNNGWFQFLNGNLGSGFVNQVTLTNGNKIINNGTNKLTATITTSSGLFKVTATDPATGKSVTGNGVLFQKGNFGGGFFLGTNESGSVSLEPANPE